MDGIGTERETLGEYTMIFTTKQLNYFFVNAFEEIKNKTNGFDRECRPYEYRNRDYEDLIYDTMFEHLGIKDYEEKKKIKTTCRKNKFSEKHFQKTRGTLCVLK